MNHQKALAKQTALWKNTPYVMGQQCPGSKGGVDCVRLCDAILQAMTDQKLDPLPRYASDSAFHNQQVVQEMQRLLFDRFELFSVRPASIESVLPGDMLVLRQKTSLRDASSQVPGGHHVAMAALNKATAIDSWPRTGVRILGLGGLCASFDLLKIWRSGMLK